MQVLVSVDIGVGVDSIIISISDIDKRLILDIPSSNRRPL